MTAEPRVLSGRYRVDEAIGRGGMLFPRQSSENGQPMQYPIPGIGAWNLVIGFGIAFVGFLMTTRWR